MNASNTLRLIRHSGRLLILLGLIVTLYNWFIQHPSAISPVALVLMAVGVLTVTAVELTHWVQTGSWRLK